MSRFPMLDGLIEADWPLSLSIGDCASLAWFFACWGGYARYSDKGGFDGINLTTVMMRHRYRWMMNMLSRLPNDRLPDLRTIEALAQANTFLASTVILVIGGLVAAMVYGRDAMNFLNTLPFAVFHTPEMWFTKTGVLCGVCVYIFFKLTWVIRQLSYVNVMILSAPYRTGRGAMRRRERVHLRRLVFMISNSAKNFNGAVRGLYFALSMLCWYIHPVWFVLSVMAVMAAMYKREFLSRTLVMLRA